MTKRKTLAWRLNKDDDGGFDEIVVGMGLAGHQALLHAEMMNARDIFVSIGPMRWLVLVAVAAWGLAGCGNDTWRGDERFSKAQRAELQAANVWAAEKMGTAPIRIEWVALDSDDVRTIRRADGQLNPGLCGDTGIHQDIRLESVGCAANLGVVFAHELGHARGMQHHDEPGLMHPAVPLAFEWSASDEVDCAAHCAE